jgi:hypothetical protein
MEDELEGGEGGVEERDMEDGRPIQAVSAPRLQLIPPPLPPPPV